jgi:hypothetical protein
MTLSWCGTNPTTRSTHVRSSCSRQVKFGWIPDYLLDQLHKSRDAGHDFGIFVQHANGPKVPWHRRLLFRLEVRSLE